MDLFSTTMKKEILELFKDNKIIQSRKEFLGKYRHDQEYVDTISTKLNKPKEEIYKDCVNFSMRLNKYIYDAQEESVEEMQKQDKHLYGKDFFDAVCHKVADKLNQEEELY